MGGRVNLIGMEHIKEKFGARWNVIAERVDRIARNVIEKRLAQGDVYCAWQETGYLMIFATLSPEQAAVKCALLAREIKNALLGAGEGAEGLEIKCALARIDSGTGLEDVQWMEDMPIDSIAFEEASEPDSERPIAACVVGQDDRLSRLRFNYRPIWDTARCAIATYRCVVGLANESLELAGGEADSAEHWLVQVDRAMQLQVIEDIKALIAQDQRLLLMMPVHFETLASWPRRQDYVSRLEALPTSSQQLVVSELMGTPMGVPLSRLVEMIAPLRRYCRAVAVHSPLAAVDFSPLKGAGAMAVGCDIRSQTGPELAIIRDMGLFERAAVKAGLASYVCGIQTRSLAAAALGAGFTYIAGDAVAELSPRPGSVVKFNILDMYRPLVQAE